MTNTTERARAFFHAKYGVPKNEIQITNSEAYVAEMAAFADDRTADLRTVLADARETLEHYANRDQWHEGDGGTFGIYGVTDSGDQSGFERAAECLTRLDAVLAGGEEK